ncbi:MAG: hypothetical protein JXA94_07390 [Parachlamydiales bacterium]|nr:hypothetical protein [Parachlamydiales bacterium]
MHSTFLKHAVNAIFVRSWWTILFLLIAYIGFSGGMKKRNKDIYELKSKLCLLQNQQAYLARQKDDLTARINSQSDPTWVELVLMKELGVVPEGKIKVHFKN